MSGIRSAVVCVTLLDRLKGDQVSFMWIEFFCKEIFWRGVAWSVVTILHHAIPRIVTISMLWLMVELWSMLSRYAVSAVVSVISWWHFCNPTMINHVFWWHHFAGYDTKGGADSLAIPAHGDCGEVEKFSSFISFLRKSVLSSHLLSHCNSYFPG